MRSLLKFALPLALLLPACAAGAQEVDHGVLVKRGWLSMRKEIEPLDIRNSGAGDQMKGARRIAITVFNVAFPDTYKVEAKSHGAVDLPLITLMQSRKSSMATRISGIDLTTRQRIADAAYADFVAQLRAAGFEVVEAAALAVAAPEFATWESQPAGAQGRFGTYLAPTGMKVRFMPGDTGTRAVKGLFAAQTVAMRTLDRTQAFQRSPYVAHDANVTAVAVNLVVDYGVYSNSGDRKGYGKRVSTGFEEGATIAAGDALNTATMVRVWSPRSGGFPTQIALQQPVISDADLGPAVGSPGDYTIEASPATFTPAALDVAGRVNGAVVGVMVAHN